jgi:hypothetical protein
MTRLMIALPLTLAAFAAGPALSETLRDQVRAGVAEQTEARLDARELLPSGAAAENRLDVIDTRLDRREIVGCTAPQARHPSRAAWNADRNPSGGLTLPLRPACP